MKGAHTAVASSWSEGWEYRGLAFSFLYLVVRALLGARRIGVGIKGSLPEVATGGRSTRTAEPAGGGAGVVLRLAWENPRWGHRRICGELAKLG